MKRFFNEWGMVAFCLAVVLYVMAGAWAISENYRRLVTLKIEVQLLRDRAERNDITLEWHRRRLRDLER